ncbi:MAG: SusC/RagA family TonB-linked outer membrane protein [Balneolaceae bacterium]
MKRTRTILLPSLCCVVSLMFLWIPYTPTGTLYGQSEDLLVINSSSKDHFYAVRTYSDQIDELKKVIIVEAENESRENVLRDIARKANLGIAYHSDHPALDESIDLDRQVATVADALMIVLEGSGYEAAISRMREIVLHEVSTVHAESRMSSEAFQHVVSGRVIDADSEEPLPGVNIFLQGSTNVGTTTDLDGNYRVTLPDANGTLIFAYIGYGRQEVGVNGRETIDINLTPEALLGEGVVVTAFGIARERASLGYSVTEVQGEGLTQARDINVASSLSGRIAGVNASGMGTGPGGSSRVIIRGAGSLDGNNQPLYVVNGMPMTNDARTISTTGGSQVDRGDGISNINPDDIESITVLKGGAAAALYGSQAANGVILITTKQGTQQRDGIGVEWNSNLVFGTINVYPDYQYEYGQGVGGQRPQTQANAHSTGRLVFGERHDGAPTVNFDGEMRPYSAVNVKENMKEFYRPSSAFTNTLSFSGGNDTAIYRLSLSNLDAESIQPNSGYTRQTVNLNVKAFLSDRLSVESALQYNYEEGRNRPGHNYAPENVNWGVTLLANTVPIEALSPGYDPETLQEVEWQSVNVAHNPYYTVNRIGNRDNRNRVMAQGKITYNILQDLYVQADMMRDFEVWEAVNYVPIGTAFTPNGNYRSFNEDKARTNVRVLMGYDQDLTSDIGVSALVGGNIERVNNEIFNLEGVDFIVPEWISPTNLGTTSSSRGAQTSGTNSVFGSADFDFRDTYYLNVTGRQDWFSTLNPGNNSIFYPSIGGSLVLSRAVDLPDVISYARIRASWAEVGGSTVNPYVINQTYGYQQGGHLGVPVQTTSSQLSNPNLRPLTSRTNEVGLDMEFLDGRLGFDLTFYDRLNQDDMVTTSLAPSSGASSTVLNVGEIQNRGVEMLIFAEPVRTQNFSWNVSYNLGYNQNKVLTLAPGQATGATSLLGRDLSTTFRRGFATTADGTPIYNSSSNYELRGPEEAIGPGVPPTTMGLENTFQYKNFSLNVLFDGKFGNHYFSRHHQYMFRFGFDKGTLPGRENGLTVEGVDENGNAFTHTWPASFMATYYNNMGTQNQKLFVQDGSFIKLRSLVASYNIPVQQLGFLGVQSAQVSLVGRNLLILYRKTDHFDPEQSFDPNSNTQNFAGTQLPRTREIGMNLRVNF